MPSAVSLEVPKCTAMLSPRLQFHMRLHGLCRWFMCTPRIMTSLEISSDLGGSSATADNHRRQSVGGQVMLARVAASAMDGAFDAFFE